MPRNEEGEYELILDNKKLLSIFFVVVVLLGVGFTLGFVLGRGSGQAGAVFPESVAEKTPAEKAAAKTPGDQPSTAVPSPRDASKPDPAGSAVPPPVEAAPTRSTEPVARAAEREPEPRAKKESAGTVPYRTGVPPAGSAFIQVASVSRSDAEMEATTLAEKGYPTWVAPGDKDDVFRVLVGPFTETTGLSKAKASLEQLGFKRAFKKEYKK